MCGIAGIVPRQAADPKELAALVHKMTRALVHRGPDDEGFFVTPQIALGMRRLSIVDVSNGQQPMSTADRSKVLVFNGEIYNHKRLRRDLETLRHSFRTHCDTETVLHCFDQWGTAGSKTAGRNVRVCLLG